MSKLSKFILEKVMGWRVITNFPEVAKCVLVVAPHTSNWDFVVGKLAYSSLGRNANFLIKAEWFFFPFNIFFKSIGGIPVRRGRSGSLTDRLAEEFRLRDRMHLAIAPEGTRKPVKNWKKGFYFIALKAKVPIVLIALDWGKKEAIVKDMFYPTGDFDSDIINIKSYYKDVKGKIPKNFIP